MQTAQAKSRSTKMKSKTPYRCGRNYDGASCENNLCCSNSGWCGLTKDYCGVGCQSNCDGNANYLYKCTQSKQVLMTFDDGPSDNFAKLLEILKSLNVKAIFFIIGMNIKDNEDLLKQAIADGHSLGVHTWSHPYLTGLRKTEIIREIQSTVDALQEVTGIRPIYFRPPYLDYNDKVHEWVTYLDLKPVWVTMDTKDYSQGPSKILQNVKEIIKKKDYPSFISLQHDSYIGSVESVKEMVEMIRQAEYEIVSVDQCFDDTNNATMSI